MTTDEAKQTIINKVLATKDGWRLESTDLFGMTCEQRNYSHPLLQRVLLSQTIRTMQVSCEYSIRAGEMIIMRENDPNGAIAAIISNAESAERERETREIENQLIAIAESL